jgi:hypothetical protein
MADDRKQPDEIQKAMERMERALEGYDPNNPPVISYPSFPDPWARALKESEKQLESRIRKLRESKLQERQKAAREKLRAASQHAGSYTSFGIAGLVAGLGLAMYGAPNHDVWASSLWGTGWFPWVMLFFGLMSVVSLYSFASIYVPLWMPKPLSLEDWPSLRHTRASFLLYAFFATAALFFMIYFPLLYFRER